MTSQSSPLDVLLQIMRTYLNDNDFKAAAEMAKAAAPYLHAKPSAGATPDHDFATMKDEELVELCRRSMARTGTSEANTD